MNKRIRAIRIRAGLNQQQFAEKLNLTQGAISGMESGDSIPKGDTLAAICREFNIDGTWLLTGEYREEEQVDISKEELALIKAIRDLK